LHDDLRADLEALGCDSNLVRLYASIEDFIEVALGPEPATDEQVVDEARALLEDDPLREYILEELTNVLWFYGWGIDEDLLGADVESGAHQPHRRRGGSRR
jgi:hypothetical protein